MNAALDPAVDEEFEFDLWDELRPIIEHATLNDERSLQTEIGPSGLGTPCVRKLAHRLANTPPANTEQAPWRPFVGRAVHVQLANIFEALNMREFETMHNSRGNCRATWCDYVRGDHTAPFGVRVEEDQWLVAPGAIRTEFGWHKLRYLTEFEVAVGTINGRTIMGHIDLYDRARKLINDWKIAGPKSLKDHHAHGMGDEYKVQQHSYGYGANRAGLPVERIATTFLPMNGELRDGYVLSEAYDPEVRKEAFRRARVIEAAHAEALDTDLRDTYGTLDGQAAAAYDCREESTEARRQFFRKLKTAPDYCARCPWFAPGATDFEAACPGDTSIYEGDNGKPGEWEGLI